MKSKQFSYAITLFREGSFSRAAEVLHISQPSLSQYIKKLESELGQVLFERRGGEVTLTQAGRIYIEAGQRILEAERQMAFSLSDLAQNKTGEVVIGAAPYRAASILPQVACAFQAVHPGMHLVVREGTTDELTEGMARGEYDLALTLLPLDANRFDWEEAFEEEIVLAVPASFRQPRAEKKGERKYPVIDPAFIAGKRLVMLTEGQYMQKRLREMEKEFHLSLMPAVVVKSLEAQIEMVRSGIGPALVPSGIERFCRPSEVAFYSLSGRPHRRCVAVMWSKGRPLSRAAEEVKDAILSLCR